MNNFYVKNNIINKLDDIYKNNEYLRFLYVIQLNSILKHLDSKIKIESIIRFILDNANDRDTINDGFIANNVTSHDYINNSNIYLDNIFENISKYLNSLFQNNGLSLKNHYKNMRIFTKEDYKGIYQIQSLSGTMENDILKIFLKLTGRLPVAQNILIINNDSLYEEIQSFLYRAIFCQYNILFIVEINETLQDNHKKNIDFLINKIFNEKKKKYNQENVGVDKNMTNEYIDSCIIFIYKENESLFNEINIRNPKNFNAIQKDGHLQLLIIIYIFLLLK